MTVRIGKSAIVTKTFGDSQSLNAHRKITFVRLPGPLRNINVSLISLVTLPEHSEALLSGNNLTERPKG